MPLRGDHATVAMDQALYNTIRRQSPRLELRCQLIVQYAPFMEGAHFRSTGKQAPAKLRRGPDRVYMTGVHALRDTSRQGS